MSTILRHRLSNYVGGEWIPSKAREALPVPNPATEEILAEVPLSTESDVEAAVGAARKAFAKWKEMPVTERVRILFRFRERLVEQIDSLARTVTEENGKTLSESKAEIWRGIEVVEFATGMPSLMKGEVTPQVSRGVDMEMVRYPVGVVAGIAPFNFPVMVPLWMIPLALDAGNTFILKPSERTPLSAVRLMELAAEAGVPEGVLNLVHGGKRPSTPFCGTRGSKPFPSWVRSRWRNTCTKPQPPA